MSWLWQRTWQCPALSPPTNISGVQLLIAVGDDAQGEDRERDLRHWVRLGTDAQMATGCVQLFLGWAAWARVRELQSRVAPQARERAAPRTRLAPPRPLCGRAARKRRRAESSGPRRRHAKPRGMLLLWRLNCLLCERRTSGRTPLLSLAAFVADLVESGADVAFVALVGERHRPSATASPLSALFPSWPSDLGPEREGELVREREPAPKPQGQPISFRGTRALEAPADGSAARRAAASQPAGRPAPTEGPPPSTQSAYPAGGPPEHSHGPRARSDALSRWSRDALSHGESRGLQCNDLAQAAARAALCSAKVSIRDESA